MQKNKTVAVVSFCVRMLAGCILYSAGFSYFLYPNSIVSGGATGVAMILNLLTKVPVGVLVIILNIPLFLGARKQFGTRFIWTSLTGMLLTSIFLDVMAMYPAQITSEPILGAVYGGVFMGLGLGIIYTTGATTGGVDIAAKMLRKRLPHVNMGTCVLIFDALIITVFAVVFKEYENAMYAVISVFITSKLIDFVLYGAVNSKLCYIIANDVSEIKKAINERLVRGATIISAKGSFTGEDKQVILCAISTHQIVSLRSIIKECDEEAFIVICDAREVFGQGFADIDE